MRQSWRNGFRNPAPFARITVAQSDGRSRYDAFTVAFRKRYAERKYQLNAHYTLRGVAWTLDKLETGNVAQNQFFQFGARLPTRSYGR